MGDPNAGPRSTRRAGSLRPSVLAALAGLWACGQPPFRAEPPPDPKDGLAVIEPVAYSPDDDLTGVATADGRSVVYVSQQNANLDVWVRDYARNSNAPITLNPADDFDPALAPDGQRLVFVSRRLDAKGDLFLNDGLGAESDLEPLTDPKTQDRQPTFAPDGNTLYYTSSLGIGPEQIYSLRLDDRTPRPISPGPGFDPAVSGDGRYLVYTQPAAGAFAFPHLVALRLSDSATIALSAGQAPEGFGRFLDPRTLAFVRFLDDDNQDGQLDAHDQASLWRVTLDLDALFQGRAPPLRPEPLTNGAEDELFPSAAAGYLYFTQGSRQQDVVRLPKSGLFPDYADPADYFTLARAVDDVRTRIFILRKAAAKAPPGSRLEAEAQLQVARLFLGAERSDLAIRTLRELLAVPASEDRGPVVGLAEVELLSLDRQVRYAAATTPAARQEVLEDVRAAASKLAQRHPDVPAVGARLGLEQAELTYLAGDRASAIAALEGLVAAYRQESASAARASLRRIELLGVAHDPDALGEAYAQVIRQFPEEREVVKEAARRMVAAQLADLAKGEGWRAEVDALRRLIPRYGPSPVQTEARVRLAELLREHKAYGDTALELSAILEGELEDRFLAARTWLALAEVEEAQGAYDRAIRAWSQVRTTYGDLPGYGARAREALTRLNLMQAGALEAKGDREAARLAYRSVIDNDLTQARAHRRYLALSAETDHLDEAIEEAARRAEAQPGTPIARYAYGLALSYAEPPDFDGALSEIEEAIRLNPQFTYAYITRGWLKEMAELEEPGILASIGSTFVDVIRGMVGGVLDVPIGQSGPLESAIDDYRTALSLNPESTAPETESEILLDIGNAQYRLAEQTKDASNMRSAFERYLEALQLGLALPNRRAEVVYWERLGRAAAWLEEYAISVMATRQAISLAEAEGIESRLPQLYGNLSLAYGQAGEEAYARFALERFQDTLKKRDLEEKLVVSLRDLAFAQLAKRPHQAPLINEILGELLSARRSLRRIGRTDRGELPTAWRPLGNDATRAQYGFSKPAEMNLNLALTETAHGLLGEAGRVEQLRAERERVTEALLADPEKSICLFFGLALCVVEIDPLVLGQLRERLGLLTARARAAHERGDWAGAQVALQSAEEELETWITDERLPKAGLALAADRGRLAAIWAELALHPPAGVSPNLDEQAKRVERAQVALAAALVAQTASTAPEASDADRTELLALTTTTSVEALVQRALGPPRVSRPRLEVRRVQARLGYVQAWLTLARRGALPAEVELRAALLGLDEELRTLERARTLFDEAARTAASAGPGAASLLASSLARVAELDRRLGRPDLGAMGAAQRLARATGDLRTTLEFELAGFDERDPTRRARALEVYLSAAPHQLASQRRWVEDLAARSASIALGAQDLGRAFQIIDRWALLNGTGGGRGAFTPGNAAMPRAGSEAELAYWAELRAREATLASARSALASSDDAVTAEDLQGRLEKVAAAATSVSAWLEKPELSDRAAARVLGRSPLDLDGVGYELAPDEGLVVYFPLGPELHALWVDGSTTTTPKVRTFKVSDDALSLSQALAQLDDGLLAGRGLSPDRREALRQQLYGGLGAGLEGKRILYVAGGLAFGPLPVQLHPERVGVAQLGAPSLLGLLRGGQLVGLDGAVAIGPEREAIFGAEQRLEGEEALSLAKRVDREKLEPGVARELSSIPLAQQLADRAKDRVLVDGVLTLEPTAPERSAIQVAPALDDPQDGELADQFLGELALEDLTIPARLYTFGRVRGPRRALYGLELALLGQGVATTLVFPDGLPSELVQRIERAYSEREAELGPVQALRRAIEPELAAFPGAGLITLLGAPGLDRAGTKAWAEAKLPEARTQALNAVNKRQYAEAVPRLERWIRLMRLAEKHEQIEIAYGALVGIFRERLEPPDPVRGIEAQRALLAYLEEHKKNGKKGLDARLELALLYGQAQDYLAAEALFEEVLAALLPLDDGEGLARAYFKYGRFKKDARDYERSARLMEEAIQRYDRIGVYDRPKVPAKKGDPVLPPEAEQALAQLGDTYLNALSDPDRARRAYERALRWAKSDDDRVGAEIDLARVGRRAGDFAAARVHAERAIEQAEKAGLRDLRLSAVIEAANVAWYQGDYRRGGILCQESLSSVDQLIEAQKKEAALPAGKGAPVKRLNPRALLSGKIYALSVCGLVAMSQRNFDQAQGYLERAKRIAGKLGGAGESNAARLASDREVATQFNNLGRVYLEFGRADEAIESFLAAKAIDERLGDRYALAYDLRNLGGAFAFKKDWARAEEALGQGLEFARLVRDTNNELRALFTLAEVAVGSGRAPLAKERYRAALPLAEKLGVQELAWQIHRGLGLLAKSEGQPLEAERELRTAMRLARTITGRSAPSEFGPGRYAAFDDLMLLLLEEERVEEAFVVANDARALEQVEFLDDDRITWSRPEVKEVLGKVRKATTATAAKGEVERLRTLEPSLGAILEIGQASDLAQGIPEDAGIIVYRTLADRLVSFALDGRGVVAFQSKIEARALRTLIAEYGRRLSLRSEPVAIHEQLSALLLGPLSPWLEGKKRLAIVPHQNLRYVAFGALPVVAGGKETLLDRAVLVQALHPAAARRGLFDRAQVGLSSIVALGGALAPPGSSDPPLPFAEREVKAIAEELPGTVVQVGAAVTKSAVLEALRGSRGVVHFAGHGFLAGPDPRGRFVDPLGGQLRTSDGPLTMLETLGARNEAELVVLSACSSAIWPRRSAGGSGGDELLSMAQTFQLTGARRVLGTTIHVHDLAASLVMKHFYRAARTMDAASALREAQLKVRRRYPHPSWWATFVLSEG